jgi:thioredoxin 1
MKLELFFAAGCASCDAAREGLKAAARQEVPDLVWRDVNVLDELDYAVELGVLTLPAVVIDGELVFARLPSPTELGEAIAQRRTTGA